MSQFQVLPHREGSWVVAIRPPSPDCVFYLGYSSNDGSLAWSSDIHDAKPFHIKKEAIEFVLKRTEMRKYREPLRATKPPQQPCFLEVDFSARTVIVHNGGEPYSMPFEVATAIRGLPIYKG